MPTLELKNPSVDEQQNSIKEVPFTQFISNAIQKVYNRPGDAINYTPPTTKENNQLDLLNEKITVSVETGRQKISGKGNTLMEDTRASGGVIDPSTSTRWEGGGTPAITTKDVEISRFQLPTVLAEDVNATFKDPLLGGETYKVADFFANKNKFNEIKTSNSTVANSVYGKFINYDNSNVDVLYDKNDNTKAVIAPTKTALWGNDNLEQDYVKNLVVKGGYTEDYAKQITKNRMFVFPEVELNDDTLASIIKNNLNYSKISQVVFDEKNISNIDFAKNLLKANDNSINTDNLIRTTEAKEVRYDLDGKINITDNGDFAWKRISEDSNKDFWGGDSIWQSTALGINNLGKSLTTATEQNPFIGERATKTIPATALGTASTFVSLFTDSLQYGSLKLSGITEEDDRKIEVASRKVILNSFKDPVNGKPPQDWLDGAINLGENVIRGKAKINDIDVVKKVMYDGAVKNTQKNLQTVGLSKDFSINGVRVDQAAGSFTNSAMEMMSTFALLGVGNVVKGTRLLSGVSKFAPVARLTPGYAGISMLQQDYSKTKSSDIISKAGQTFFSARFEMFFEKPASKIFDKGMGFFARWEGSGIVKSALKDVNVVSQFEKGFLELAGLAKAPFKYKVLNAVSDGLTEFGVGVVGDTIINSAFKGKYTPPDGQSWSQNALFGLVFGFAPKIVKSDPNMFKATINGIKTEKVNSSIHGDLGTVVDSISKRTSSAVVNLNGTQDSISKTEISVKDKLRDTLQKKFNVSDLSSIKGEYTLTESISKKDLYDIVAKDGKANGSKVILHNLLSRLSEATSGSPYEGFNKIYGIEGRNANGDKTTEFIGVGVKANGEPLALTSDEILEESGVDKAKKVNTIIQTMEGIAESDTFNNLKNAKEFATFKEDGKNIVLYSDGLNWFDQNGNPTGLPENAIKTNDINKVAELIGIKQLVDNFIAGSQSDPAIAKVFEDLRSKLGDVGFIDHINNVIFKPDKAIDESIANGTTDFTPEESFTKKEDKINKRLNEVFSGESEVINQYKIGKLITELNEDNFNLKTQEGRDSFIK